MSSLFLTVIVCIIAAGIVGIIALLTYVLHKFNKNGLATNVINTLPSIADNLSDLIIKGPIDTPAEKAVSIFKILADMCVNYAKKIGDEKTLTSEERLALAKEYFFKTCKSLNINTTSFDDKLAELFIEYSFTKMKESEIIKISNNTKNTTDPTNSTSSTVNTTVPASNTDTAAVPATNTTNSNT